MAADIVHIASAAVWFGGLVALIAIVSDRRRRDDPVGAGEAVSRFSALATVTVVALTVAGVIMGWMEAGGLSGLIDSTYGKVLIAKVLVVGSVVIGAWWNRNRFVPRLREAPTDETGWSTFSRVVRLEVLGI